MIGTYVSTKRAEKRRFVMVKKLACLLMAAALLLSLAACSGEETPEGEAEMSIGASVEVTDEAAQMPESAPTVAQTMVDAE